MRPGKFIIVMSGALCAGWLLSVDAASAQHRRHHHHHGYGGAGIAAGIAAGALLGAMAARPAASSDAIAYCARRFRSYDPHSMTYLGRDGYRHPCP